MSLPLKQNQNINFNREVREPFYQMRTPDQYKDFYALSYIISGERKLFTSDCLELVSSGDMIFIKKDMHFRNTYLNESTYERICVKFTDTIVNELISVIGKQNFDHIFDTLVFHFNEESQIYVMKIFDMMENEMNCYSKYSELVLKGLLNQIMILTLRYGEKICSTKLKLAKNERYIIQAVQYVDSHYSQSPSMEDMASMVFLSPSYFSKLFSKAMGCTYSTYLTYVKLDHAQRLLASTEYSITEISLLCGFSNSNYFCNVFSKINECSPSSFRKKYHK